MAFEWVLHCLRSCLVSDSAGDWSVGVNEDQVFIASVLHGFQLGHTGRGVVAMYYSRLGSCTGPSSLPTVKSGRSLRPSEDVQRVRFLQVVNSEELRRISGQLAVKFDNIVAALDAHPQQLEFHL
jgi:hypothetical protein